MNAISLIVRGDDFGLCHASNQACAEAFETGLLTCASLVVTTPWVAEAATLAHEHPEWEIGLQLVLHCPTAGYRWGPVLGARTVPSLVEPAGTFPPSLAAAAQADEIARELDAQVERAWAWGVRPAYLEYDGASHPAVDTTLHELSERLGLPARMTAWAVQRLCVPAPSEKPRWLDVDEALARLSSGVYLWLTHPAHDSPETWNLWTGHETAQTRHADSLALCSPELRASLEQRGIERISFRQHLEERLGTEAEE